jgi:hypothetical protein
LVAAALETWSAGTNRWLRQSTIASWTSVTKENRAAAIVAEQQN